MGLPMSICCKIELGVRCVSGRFCILAGKRNVEYKLTWQGLAIGDTVNASMFPDRLQLSVGIRFFTVILCL
jgi:hypothetical protein